MLPADYGDPKSQPWTYRKRIIPLKTYCGKVVHVRKKHFFRMEDAERIMARLQPPDDVDGTTWAEKVLRILRDATILMLQRILPFLTSRQVESFYDFCIRLLDQFFRQDLSQEEKTKNARRLIITIAQRVGLTVEV